MGVDVGGGFTDYVIVVAAWGKICVEYPNWYFLDGGVDVCKIVRDDDLG